MSINRKWLSKTPHLNRAIADYARLAHVYDRETRWIDAARDAAVARLAPQPGEVVADIACGTGFCLPALSRGVGGKGKVIGVESSAVMIAHARAKVGKLTNVELIKAPAHTARFRAAPDALLFSFTHDVLQSHIALHNVLAQAKQGARVVVVGSKFFPWWLAARNLRFLAGERGYVTTYRGFSRPWRLLASYLEDFAVSPLAPGNKYIATGRLLDPPDCANASDLKALARTRFFQ